MSHMSHMSPVTHMNGSTDIQLLISIHVLYVAEQSSMLWIANIHTHTHTNKHTHTQIFKHIYTHTHAHTHIHTHTHTHRRRRRVSRSAFGEKSTHTQTRTHKHMYTYIHMHICTSSFCLPRSLSLSPPLCLFHTNATVYPI